MPSCSSHHLTWVSLTLGVGYLFTAGPAKHSQCLDEGYLLTAAIPDIQRGIAPLGPPVPARPQLLGLLLPAAGPGLRLGVAPQGHCPWPRARGGFWLSLISDAGCLLRAITGLGRSSSLLWACPKLSSPISLRLMRI